MLLALVLLGAARASDAGACAPLPLGDQFRWFHVPKTGSSFSVTLWRTLCPSLPLATRTKLWNGAVWPRQPPPHDERALEECWEPRVDGVRTCTAAVGLTPLDFHAGGRRNAGQRGLSDA